MKSKPRNNNRISSIEFSQVNTSLEAQDHNCQSRPQQERIEVFTYSFMSILLQIHIQLNGFNS